MMPFTTFFYTEWTVVSFFIVGGPLFLLAAILQNLYFGALAILFAGFRACYKGNHTRVVIQQLCVAVSFAALVIGLLSCSMFNYLLCGFQFFTELKISPLHNNTLTLGADGLSLIFLLLTLFVFPLLFLSAWNILKNAKEFYTAFLAMEVLLILTFLTTDLFYFYVFFESLLIPMFMVIGVWGARERKIKAAYLFFMYTLFGSLFMLFGIFQLYTITGSTDYEVLQCTILTSAQQNLIWICFFIAFAVKMPLYPFHIWLPEAHVESPTVGSMLLASLLLKLGAYGFLRFSLTFLSEASVTFTPVVSIIAVLGIVYGSLTTIRQADLKRIVAYSSVAHMNLVMLSLFSKTQEGLDGAIFTLVAHGFVSAALFFGVGVLYDHYHSRLLSYYGGLTITTPLLAFFFLVFTLANMGFPGTSNFVGEILMFFGIFNSSSGSFVFAITGVVLGAVYSVWLFNRVFFTTLKRKYMRADGSFGKVNFFVLTIFTVVMLLIGLCASAVTLFSYLYIKWTIIAS
jgi:proton-translocating NADH-quinone oxidoreductase chain M